MSKLVCKFEFDAECLSDIKRLYLNGGITLPCPSCKENMTRDFSEDYISYLQIGEKTQFHFHCDHCDKYYIVDGIAKAAEITLEIFPETLKEDV